jgi:predicted aldo/keto reductase-like oxidoreductase
MQQIVFEGCSCVVAAPEDIEQLERELTAALARAEEAEIDIKWLISYCTMGEKGMLARIEQLEGKLTVANERADALQADRDALQRQVDAIKRYATTENCDVCPAALPQHCANGGCLENVIKALSEARKETGETK